jgi:hypothetical protein
MLDFCRSPRACTSAGAFCPATGMSRLAASALGIRADYAIRVAGGSLRRPKGLEKICFANVVGVVRSRPPSAVTHAEQPPHG